MTTSPKNFIDKAEDWIKSTKKILGFREITTVRDFATHLDGDKEARDLFYPTICDEIIDTVQRLKRKKKPLIF